MPSTLDLSTRPSLMRGPIARGQVSVHLAGGDAGAGLIRGAAVITRGEALGHDIWIDHTMLQQVRDAIQAAGQRGIKARFTHPGLSADGLGTFLGRFKNGYIDGDVVRAELHFGESAHDTPDGDLAEYVMALAAEDPTAFGNSIVFRHDLQAEQDFEATHQQEVSDAAGARKVFRSPDERNTDHLPHARLKQLRAIDCVDQPAANPGGFFHATDVAHEADELLAYACGLSARRPDLAMFDLDPDRVRGFVARFLDRAGLQLTAFQTDHISRETLAAADAPNGDPRVDFARQRELYVQEFGVANGTLWLAEGRSIDDCRELHAADNEARRQAELAAKDAQIAALTDERDTLQQTLDQALFSLGEGTPVSFSPADHPHATCRRFNSLPAGLARYAAGLRLAGH